MRKFQIKRPYTMPPEAVREAAEGLAQQLQDEHGIKADWKGDSVSIRGSSVDGKMSFGGGVIDVSVKLGMVAAMFGPALKKAVDRYLDEHLS